jgi:threonine synthase
MIPSAPLLRCIRCGATGPVRAEFFGCRACEVPGQPGAALELAHDLAAWRAQGLLETWRTTWRSREGGLWRFRELLPLPPGAEPVTLDEGATPLTRLEHAGPGRIWLKDETRNPTGAFKDRLHAVGLTMARALSFTGATAATTGNHGTSLAAYAARAGLRALVFCDPRTPELQRRLMTAYGARVVVAADRG